MSQPTIRKVEAIAVLGAGTMGRGIAHVAAVAGFETRLFDVSERALDAASSTIDRNLRKAVELGKLEEERAAAARGRLFGTHELRRACEGADLVIEAVPEQMALKIDTFRAVEAACGSEPLLATNTSALSVTEMAAATARPDRFIGLHFFNPAHLMKLVEVVRALQTSEETVATALDVCRRLGKEAVLIREAPGFVTTRINALIGNEAFRMLQEGVASAEDIDKALRLGLNHPMGPFEMIDLVGLDVRLAILEFLHRTLGESFRPNPLHVQLVRAGRLGRKTGHGVHRYDSDGKKLDD